MAVAWAAIHHGPLRRDVLRELPVPTVGRLVRAGRYGLADPELGAEARWLAERVPAALGVRLGNGADLVERAEEFLNDFTRRGGLFDDGTRIWNCDLTEKPDPEIKEPGSRGQGR